MKTNLKDFSLTSLGKVQPRATRASFGYVLWMLVLLLGGGAFEVKAMALPSPTLCATVTEISEVECSALVALYDGTGGPNLDSTTNNWNVTNTPCSWTGVYCDAGHVQSIYRFNQNLVGTIPDLSNLTELERLDLSDNQLKDTLPTTVVSPQLLYLSLDDNQLCGELPNWVGNLREVRLSRNHFTVPSDPLLSQINKATEYSSNWEPDWQATQTPCPTSPMLTIRTVGPGKVSSTTPGIDCGTDCSESYAIGTQVTLVAQSEQGSTFIRWAGACSGTGNCQVTVNDVHSVTALFNFDEAGCEVNYLARGQLSEATQLLFNLRPPIEEYYAIKGVFPTDLTILTDTFSGKYTETLSLNNTNGFYVEATMKTEAAGVSPEIAGKHLRLVRVDNWSWELASPDISAYYYYHTTSNYFSAVVEALHMLGGLKTPVEEYFSSKEEPPTDIKLFTDQVSGKYVANLSFVTENGWAIQTTFKTFAEGVSSVVAGKTIKLTYDDAANSNPWQFAPNDSNGIPSEIGLNSNGPILLYYPEELTVCQGGTGTGKITATTSYPEEESFIDCGESCSESFVKNTQVTLIATPNPGSVFKGWTNPSCGQPFPMKSYGACNAIFEIPKLTIATVGNGTVTCNGGACQSSYPAGDTVNLVATPASGFTFKGWTVDCSGTNATTTVTMDAAKNCTAVFINNPVGNTIGLTLTPSSILTDSQMGTTPLDINPTGSCSSWTATTKPGGYITNLLVSPTSGTGNATITISYRKSSVVSPKKGNAKVIVTATCGTATVKKTVIIR